MQRKNRRGPKLIQNARPERADSKIIKLILDLKAEVGILCKAMVQHGISVESAPTSKKQKEQAAIVKQKDWFLGKQKDKFVGITKKRNRS
jgi:hypothetical protein